MAELMSHLKFPLDGVLEIATVLPSIAPYATSGTKQPLESKRNSFLAAFDSLV
jgi:hypothetical protein